MCDWQKDNKLKLDHPCCSRSPVLSAINECILFIKRRIERQRSKKQNEQQRRCDEEEVASRTYKRMGNKNSSICTIFVWIQSVELDSEVAIQKHDYMIK